MKRNPAFTNAPFPPGTPPEGGDVTLRSIVKLNVQVLGITLGILFGFGLFIATNFLILKGGENVGAHLGLLGQFFLGYRVTFLGSLIGLAYGFLVGYLTGFVIAVVYNWVDYLRSR